MMIQHEFSIAADAAAARYGTLVDGWRGLYAQTLNSPRFGTPRNLESLQNQAYELGRRFLEGEVRQIATAFAGIVREALRASFAQLSADAAQSEPEAVTDHSEAIADYLRTELAIQIERDIAFLRQSLQRVQLQVSLAARSQGIQPRAALLAYQMTSGGELTFFFHDRRNQKWPSRRFVRTLWRHNLLTLYNETVLLVLAEHGDTIALVEHANPDAEAHGMQIAMGSNSALPVYTDIRNEIFHPNSDAIIARWFEEA